LQVASSYERDALTTGIKTEDCIIAKNGEYTRVTDREYTSGDRYGNGCCDRRDRDNKHSNGKCADVYGGQESQQHGQETPGGGHGHDDGNGDGVRRRRHHEEDDDQEAG